MKYSAYAGTTLAVTLLALGMAFSAHATNVQEYNADTSAAATDFAVDGSTILPFIAEGRIGGAGTFEIDTGKNTSNSSEFSQSDHNWTNGGSDTFSLSFDGNQAIWKVGTDTVSYSNLGPLTDFNSLLIRTATPNSGTSISFSNLALNGSTLGSGSYSNTYDTDASDADRLVKWLSVTGTGDLASGFTLSGDVALGWTNGDRPSNSNLAFQIKAANAQSQSVPEPGALGIMALGLLGIGIAMKRRRRC